MQFIHSRKILTTLSVLVGISISSIAIAMSKQPEATAHKDNDNSSNVHIVEAKDIQWAYLNPLRGDKSPRAANLWGNLRKNVATGMLVKFKDGFSSPPHIHNITYRAVVINGSVHNDDPSAAKMWMPTGSYWTQPAGESHITAAKGADSLIFLEIDSGPYLVKPEVKQFDNGERPLNMHVDNIVWQSKAGAADTAYLWGSTKEGKLRASLLKLPAGFSGTLTSNASDFKAVIISGGINYQLTKNEAEQLLSSGSYLSADGKLSFNLSSKKDSIIYLRLNDNYEITVD